MSQLKNLQAATSLTDLAKLLHYTPKGLAYILYKVPAASKYNSFTIPKSNGGTRHIDAPVQPLKLAQERLAALLYDCLDELEKDQPHRSKLSHGFHRGRSIITNAVPHRRRRYVLNLDLTDFFGTINFGRVRGLFIKDTAFQLDPAVATVIAQVACHENKLPQGSPCSPIISNLIARIMDVRLAQLAKANGCTYTRYADDLTFSTNQRIFPPKLAKPNKAAPHKWRLAKALRDEIKNAGFSINPKKTRMQICGSRQEVTGLVVNEKINVSQNYYRTVRSMAHSLFSIGQYHVQGTSAPTTSLAPLEGRLAHVYYVKSRRDRSERANKLENFQTPKAPRELYRRYLFYKYCIAPSQPILVTEGKTDITYISCALRALHPAFGNLAQTVKGNFVPKIGFVRPSYINNSVLGLGSSASQLTELISSYLKRLKYYRHKPLGSPVIIVADNDDAVKNILKAANGLVSSKLTQATLPLWTHLTDNLYLVRTPKVGAKVETCMEDLFPAALKSTLVDGKPFDPKKDHGDSTAYGKAIFAERVVKGMAKPKDFTAFNDLLQAIDDCVSDYSGKLASSKLTLPTKAAIP